MFDEPVVFVDIETSGSSPTWSKIIEIGLIRVEDGQVSSEYQSLVNPGRSLPQWISSLTGITDSDLIQAPYFEDVAYQLHSLLEGAIFIAHNVQFDFSFIQRQLRETGYEWKPKLLCTVRLSRALYPAYRRHSLEKIIERHAIAVAARHRALDDARAIKAFAELAYAEHGSDKFHQAVRAQLKSRTYPPNLKPKEIEALPNKTGVYIFEAENGGALYVGKSVKLRGRILDHFNQALSVEKELKLTQGVHRLKLIETDTELEALLLESKLVKELLPLHNRQLRRTVRHAVLIKDYDEDGYARINVGEVDISQIADLSSLSGIYLSRSRAKTALLEKQKTFGLCPKLLGIEKGHGACFSYQLGKCAGACAGEIDAMSYNRLVDLALERSRVDSWPFSSAVAILEGDNHFAVLDRWIVIGYLRLIDGSYDFEPTEKRFDLDTYRIVRGYLKKHAKSLKVVPLSSVLDNVV